MTTSPADNTTLNGSAPSPRSTGPTRRSSATSLAEPGKRTENASTTELLLQRALDPHRASWPAVVAAVERITGSEDADLAHDVPIPAQELIALLAKLRSQPVIEQAKGVLMGYYGLDADTAFTVLKRWSQHSNIKLRAVAQAIVDGTAQQAGNEIPPHDQIQRLMPTYPRAPVDGS